MLKDITLLGIGGLFGLGATVIAMAAPLYFPTAPRWIWHYSFWLGLAVILVSLSDMAIMLLFKDVRIGTVAYSSLAFLFAAAAIVHQTSGRDPRASSSVYAQCSKAILPIVQGPTGEVDYIYAVGETIASSSFGQAKITGPEGTKIPWPPLEALTTSKCEITNYLPRAIFNVEVVFDATIQDLASFDNETRSFKDGVIPKRSTLVARITKIDAGSENRYNLYFYNLTGFHTELNLKPELSYSEIGQNDRKTEKIAVADLLSGTILSFGQGHGPPIDKPSKVRKRKVLNPKSD